MLAAPGEVRAETSWLCLPETTDDPCDVDLTTTHRSPNGTERVITPKQRSNPKTDCFYVYPTASDQPTTNANKNPDPPIQDVASVQAGRFSQLCRTYAPLYRQLTIPSLFAATTEQLQAGAELAYSDVKEAFYDYLENHNRGRGFTLIGHSQGTGMLGRLLAEEIDTNRKLRKQFVSGLLLGGNIVVPEGKRVGAQFQHIPVCSKRRGAKCIVAYSLYNQIEPEMRFGQTGGRFAEIFGFPDGPGLEIACTNPTLLKGGESRGLKYLTRSEIPRGSIGLAFAGVHDLRPPMAPTPWVRPADRYEGRCVRGTDADGKPAHVLEVEPIGDSEELRHSPTADWGLHLVDVNLPYGNLLKIARAQIKTYLRKARR
ncbi:MAG: DUF3089 domain-containing protein [Solirubrobacterales bacterium]